MSAIAKPMIHTVSADISGNPSPMVNIENVVSIASVDGVPGRPGNTVDVWSIVFTYIASKTAGNQSISWDYSTAAARNTDYTQLIAAMSLAI